MQKGLSWEIKAHRTGEVDGYTVMGSKYETSAGDVGWHTTSWLTKFEDPIHELWVSSRTFYAVSIHIGTPRSLIEMFGPITIGIDQAERDAVLKAISEWERP